MTMRDERWEQGLTELHETTRRMMAAESVEDVAQIVRAAAERLLDDTVATVYLLDDETLQPTSAVDLPPSIERECRALASESIAAHEPRFRTFATPTDTPYGVVAHCLGEYGALVVGRSGDTDLSGHETELVRILATNGEVALDRAIQLRKLRDREREIVDERNRLAALFENVPSPTASFVIEDDDPVVESVNPAFERVFGYTQEELVGEEIDDYIVPPGRESEAAEYNDLLQQGKNVNVEVRRLAADGPRDFLLDVVPFRLNAPNVHGYAMYTDITERKRREQELERQNERLDQFASIVSHDIRNPLNVAKGFLDVARETPEDEYFDRVETALDRVDDIVESVLSLARHGRTVTDPVPTNLAETVEAAWRNVETKDAALGVETSVDRELYGDATRLSTLFENLFRNAVEHGSTNPRSYPHEDSVEHSSTDNRDASRLDDAIDHVGPDVSVTVGILDDESGFYILDDGPGIPAENRDRVFESGFTTRSDGTGYGLAIVKEIVDAHDWTIAVEDDEHGARFEIRDVEWVTPDGMVEGSDLSETGSGA